MDPLSGNQCSHVYFTEFLIENPKSDDDSTWEYAFTYPYMKNLLKIFERFEQLLFAGDWRIADIESNW